MMTAVQKRIINVNGFLKSIPLLPDEELNTGNTL